MKYPRICLNKEYLYMFKVNSVDSQGYKWRGNPNGDIFTMLLQEWPACKWLNRKNPYDLKKQSYHRPARYFMVYGR